MKRSEINDIIRSAAAFLGERRFELPPFAHWTLDEWRARGDGVREIVDRRLGWDITDFGSGDFGRCGLFLFTIRNGDPAALQGGGGRLYAEKILIVEPGQLTPLHFHRVKTEDIINRGGGRLVVQLYASTGEGKLDRSPISVLTDGLFRRVEAGGKIVLEPGESVTLTPGLYHAFWGENERVLVGEVSLVNDDATDNIFYEDVGRFPVLVEDETPYRLLVTDYDRFLRSA